MADQQGMNRADEVARKALELAARAEQLAQNAHEAADVDEQLAALETELDALAAEESALDAGMGAAEPIADDDADQDDWSGWAETFGERMEALGYRLGELVSGGIEAAMYAYPQGSARPRSQPRGDESPGPSVVDQMVEGATPVRIKSAGGSVDVRAGAGDRVHVTWRQRGWPRTPEREPVNVEERDGELYIESGQGQGWRHRIVHLGIEVPLGSSVDAVTGGGSVRVKGTHASVRARTGGGSIDIDDVDGLVSATTGGGSIRVRGRLRDQSAVRTGGGSVDVVLEAGASLELDAHGTMASIDVPGLRLKGPHVHGAVGGGADGSLEIRTGGGSARIRQG